MKIRNILPEFKIAGQPDPKDAADYKEKMKFFDNINKKIFSEKSAKVYDIDGNTINVENFQYSVKNNIFVSLNFLFMIFK